MIRQLAQGMATVEVLNVKIKRDTRFLKVYKAVAERTGVELGSFRLLRE